MPHSVEVVASKTLSDGAIAVCVECCGDSTTRSWHTIHAVNAMSEADLDAEITKHQERVSTQHEGRTKAENYLKKKIKTKPEAL